MQAQDSFRYSLDLIRHRGPDGRGMVWGLGDQVESRQEVFEGSFSWALGHVRLAILDTSVNGLQPMSGQNGTHWISYNGEVYNHVELKKELERTGWRFRTGTDTEVILAAYARWGEDCLERFVGMFAFVLVDLEKRRVFCARDRFGVKPLHFWQGRQGTFIFSEPKQLKAFPEFSFRANRRLLIDFMVDNVVNHVANESLFEGVIPLMPGHCLSWSLDNAFPDLSAIRPFWQLPEHVGNCRRKEAVERLGAAVIDAVGLRLRSDVPVGSCLSGGIDSSSLVGVASRDFGACMHTFSACFPGQKFDEQPYMDAVNRHCGTKPVKVFPDGEEFVREMDRLVYHQDEPFASASIYSQWCVMRAARQHDIPVLLDGQGGDEALCGYRKYNFFYLKQLLRRGNFAHACGHAGRMLVRGDRQVLRLQLGQRYLPGFLRKDDQWILEALRPHFRQHYGNAWAAGNRRNRFVHEYQRDDLLHWSLPALLRYEDRNSMAHGVESRVPLVDHRLVGLCVELPDRLFFLDGKSKRLLTAAMGDRLPPEVHRRRDKLGFSTPTADWLKGSAGRILVDEIARCRPLAEIADTGILKNRLAAYRNNNFTTQPEKLFAIGCAAVWMRVFGVS